MKGSEQRCGKVPRKRDFDQLQVGACVGVSGRKAGGDDKGIPGGQAKGVFAWAFQCHLTRHDEGEKDVAVVFCPWGYASGAGHHNRGYALGVGVDGGVARFKAGDAEGGEMACGPHVMNKALAFPHAVGVHGGVGQGHLVVDFGDVVGGDADFDHLDPIARLQNAVPDRGGLDEAIPRVQAPNATLIFIKHIDPAFDAKDQLVGFSIKERQGQTSQFVLSKFNQKPGLKDRDFEFTIPEGVEVDDQR